MQEVVRQTQHLAQPVRGHHLQLSAGRAGRLKQRGFTHSQDQDHNGGYCLQLSAGRLKQHGFTHSQDHDPNDGYCLQPA